MQAIGEGPPGGVGGVDQQDSRRMQHSIANGLSAGDLELHFPRRRRRLRSRFEWFFCEKLGAVCVRPMPFALIQATVADTAPMPNMTKLMGSNSPRSRALSGAPSG